jgi:hypothetical protein
MAAPLSAGDAPGSCGLGERAVVELRLSARGTELFGELWGDSVTEADLERIRDVTATWVREQDAFDRDRNHFMKAFRKQHGFDRTEYAPEVLAEWDAGLDEINARVNRKLEKAARRLLGN